MAIRGGSVWFTSAEGRVPPDMLSAYGHVAIQPSSRIARSRSALRMTETELKLMAAAAAIGFSSHPVSGYGTPAARGSVIHGEGIPNARPLLVRNSGSSFQ